MPKKNSLLVSATALALLAVPALAQQHDDRNIGKAGFGRESAAMHGGQPRPAPTPLPPQPGTRPPQGGQPPQGNNRPGRPEGNRPDNNNRPGWNGNNNNNRPGGDHNRPGNDNRPGRPDYNRPGDHRPGWNGNRPGGRPDYSGFRDYHRGFQAQRRFRAGTYRRPQGWYYQRWSYGQILPSLFWGQQYWLSNYGAYDLPLPPPGTVWVRYGDDALLIDRYSGEIISVQYGVFY